MADSLNSDEQRDASTPAPQAPHTPHPLQSRTMRLLYGSEALQFGELHLPGGGGPFPLVVLIHGGFWQVPYGYTLMTGLAEDLAKHGIAAWNIEYRRVGDPGGGWPATLLDVARAADFVHTLASTYALDLKRVVAMGHSAGGHLALWLVARPRAQKSAGSPEGESNKPLAIMGVVSLAGVADLEMGWNMNLGNGAVAKLLGGSPTELPERYAFASPAALLPLGVPQVLIHGTEDDRVPFAVSQAYTAAALAAGDQVTLLELPGEDHFVLINAYSNAWAITVMALRQLLQLH
jgi:acetyl esterase/lipase